MTDNIQKLYKIAGVDYEDRYCDCTLNKELECDLKCSCDICEHSEAKYIFPPFTVEKQLELIKWLAKRRDFALDYYNQVWVAKTDFCWEYYETRVEHEHFNQVLASLILELWYDLSDDQKQEIKEILK